MNPQFPAYRLTTLLLRHTHRPSPSPRRLRMLAPNPQAPVVSQTPMSPNLLQSLQILAQLAVHAISQDLAVFAIDDVALSVEKPAGDLVLRRVLDDCDDALEFFRSEFTGAA